MRVSGNPLHMLRSHDVRVCVVEMRVGEIMHVPLGWGGSWVSEAADFG